MKDQEEVQELSKALDVERENQIRELEAQLSQAQEKATSNGNAANILTDLLQKGEVKLEDDGSVTVMHGSNFVGNSADIRD